MKFSTRHKFFSIHFDGFDFNYYISNKYQIENGKSAQNNKKQKTNFQWNIIYNM